MSNKGSPDYTPFLIAYIKEKPLNKIEDFIVSKKEELKQKLSDREHNESKIIEVLNNWLGDKAYEINKKIHRQFKSILGGNFLEAGRALRGIRRYRVLARTKKIIDASQ